MPVRSHSSFFILHSSFFILHSSFNNHRRPSVLVFLDSILDIAQMVIQLGRDGTWFAVLAECVALAVVEVIKI